VHPLLLELGAWQVTSYGFALTLAFAFGIGLGVWRAPRQGLAAEPVLGLSIVIIVASIVGSRLFFALNPPVPGDAGVLDALNPFAAAPGVKGLSVMGGLPAALAASWIYLRLRGLPILAYMDLLAPSVAFGAGITRIGCFANGCCYGVVCDWPWAVRFPVGSLAHAALGDVAVHPTQLYQSAAGFAIGAGLMLYAARRNPPAGAVVCALICTWGLQRLLVEVVRHHAGGEVWFHVGDATATVYQGVAVALFIAGAVGWTIRARRTSEGPRNVRY